MNFSWKRFLSLVLAFVMVVGMVPFGALDVYAAEETEQTTTDGNTTEGGEGTEEQGLTDIVDTKTITDSAEAPAAEEGYVWVLANTTDPYLNISKCPNTGVEHTHGDSCYYLSCEHHMSTCYESSTTYAKCEHSDSSEHSGTVNITDVVTRKGLSVSWNKEHPAYPVVKATYDSLDGLNKLSILTMKFCYSISEGEEPICGHEHSAVGGECYTKICILGEHTHTDDCYSVSYTWNKYVDVNGNGQPDYDDTYFTVKYMNGEEELESHTVLVGLATPAYEGEAPTRKYYTFAGWGEVAEKVTADAVYTAQWTVNNDKNGNGTPDETEAYYNVTFMVDGVEYAKVENVLTGLSINAPVNPVKEGYGFNAWVNENGSVSFPFTVESNVTLTATFSNRAAKIGEEYFESLLEAIAAAQPGDTVVMLKDVTLGKYGQNKTDAAITIDKAITLDGNGYTLTSKASRAINVDVNGQVEIKNLTIKQYAGRNSKDQKRCINVINHPAELKVTNCNLELVEHTVSGRLLTSYTAGVNVAATAAGAQITIDGCEIGVIYGVNLYGDGTSATIKNTTIDKALQCVNIEAAATVKVENSILSTNPSFGANNTNVVFVVRAAGATITADANTVINAISASGGPAYAIYSTNPEAVLSADLSKATVNKANASDPVVYLQNAEAQIYHADGTVMYDTLAEAMATGAGKIQILADALKSEDAVAAVNDDYKLVEEDGKFYAVMKDYVAEVNGKGYTSLQKAINAANDGATVALLINLAEQTEVSVNEKTVALDLNGCTIDGDLTLKGNGTIVIESGTINGNISVLENAKLTIYGGWFKVEPNAAWAAPGYVVVYDETAAMWTVENHDIVNGNGVADEEETITVVVNKFAENDKVEFTGLTHIEGDKYAFNSNGDKVVTIVATPVVGDNNISTSFVAGVEGVEGTGAYGNGYAYTYTFTAEDGNAVTVNFAEAKFERDEDGKMRFYVGMEDPDYETLYSSVIKAPAYSAEAVGKNVKYLARTEGEYELDLSRIRELLAEIKYVGSIAVRLFDSAYPDAKTNITLEEKWLNVGDKLDEGDIDEVLEEAINAGIEEIKALIADGDYLKAISAIGELGTKVTGKIGTIGCHAFGENTLTDAEGNVQEIISVDYQSAEMHLTDDTLVVTLVDDRIETVINTEEVSVVYRDYTAESLVEAIAPALVDINGNSVAGDVVLTSKVKGTEIVGTFEVTFEYKGSYEYKPATKTVTVTVEKAPASIDIPNVQVNYNEGYSVAPKVTLGNQYGDPAELTESMVQFLIGLNIAEFDYDGDGVTGLNGKVQLILTEELQDMLNGILGLTGGNVEEGVEMSLSDLMKYLDLLPDSSLDSLNQALEAITGIVEAGDLTITLGGNLPKDAGAYLYGAVTTSPNYETAFDVAYIVIAPELKEVYLDWNYTDSNGVFTWELLKHVDLGATAYADPAFTNVDADATDVMQNLFFGINADGDLVVKLHGKHSELEALEASLGNGAYTQLAFTLDIGNKLVYAKPIVRAFVLVPNIANVQLVDAEGNALDTFNFTFDNAPKQLFVMVDGELVKCDITYTGIQTNLNVYEPTTEAPKHAGAYGAVVTYVGTDENGEIISVGIDAAVIDIAPAQSALEVTGGEFEHDGQAHGVTVNTNADVTMISGTVSFDAGGDGLGIEDVHGIVNVDFPKWVDKILSEKFANAYEYGVSTKSFLFKLQQHEAAMLEMGITEEIINSLTNLMKNLPENVVVYFNDDPAYTEPGVYAFFGIVTDSDYIPSYDTGLVTIGKETTVVDMMNTTVIFNGQGQFVNVYNPDNNDYVTIIVDRENNIGNIIFEDDLNALVALVEDALGYELPKSINVAELHNAVDKVLTAAEWIDKLDSEATTVLSQIRQVLAELPQSGVVYINGEWLPTNVGEYEFYGASYSLKFTTNLTEAVLTIVPADLTITLDNKTKVYGENDPELTYTVTGLVNGDTAEDLNIVVTREKGENAGTYAITATASNDNYNITITNATLTIEKAKVTVTMNDLTKFYGEADPNFTYTIETEYTGEFMLVVAQSRDAGEDIGSYAINPEAYIFLNDNFDVEVIPGALTIKPAEITITVQNNTVLAGTVTPDVVVNVEIVNGNVAEDTLNVQATWNAETVDGKLVHGEYANNAVTYTESNNWVVTVVDGTLTVELGDYVCWNPATAEYWDDLSDALEAVDDDAAETIEMLKDYVEKYVIIAPGTTLDLDDHTVTARFVVGMNGSYLTGEYVGTATPAQLVVDVDNITLSEECHNDGSYDVLPIYNPNTQSFQFSRFQASTTGTNRGLKIDTEKKELYFQFVTNMSGAARRTLLNDGASDNELSIVIRMTWESETGYAKQDFVFKDEHIAMICAGGKDFYVTLTNYDELGINIDTLEVQGMIITNSGAVSAGDLWTK